MHLTRLALTDFRSYAAADLELGPGVSTLLGANGQGKTNVVEAVAYVATLGSHRVASDAPLVRRGADRAILRAAVTSAERDSLVELEINPGHANRARLNRAPARPRQVLGVLRTVLFAPEDLALVKGDPEQRRRYLDDLLVATAPRYAAVRADYERVLRQRTALLKSLRGRGGARAHPGAGGPRRRSAAVPGLSSDERPRAPKESGGDLIEERQAGLRAPERGRQEPSAKGGGETGGPGGERDQHRSGEGNSRLQEAPEAQRSTVHGQPADDDARRDSYPPDDQPRSGLAGESGGAAAGDGELSGGEPAGATTRGTLTGPAAGTLGVWDEHLAVKGADLLAARISLTRSLRPLFTQSYAAVAGDAAGVSIGYRQASRIQGAAPKTDPSADLPAEPAPDREALAGWLREALVSVRAEELDRGVCLVGPHRDDLELRIGGLPARGYASHGESWSAALALRLAAYELLRAGGDDPVLLLDDVFAELDSGRRERLAAVAAGAEQVIVTAAVPEDVPPVLAGARFEVAQGTVIRA